jgi:hypothetical protein
MGALPQWQEKSRPEFKIGVLELGAAMVRTKLRLAA